MADIFLSYSRPDKAIVEELAPVLQDCGFTVWWDAELLAGNQFREKILEELSKADIVVVIWSRASTLPYALAWLLTRSFSLC